ncbi:hypothetical protein Lalb_Chr18g0049071 [Lupinus albus]|uniref:Uncharacterized protein n=1 Tax=Lupinus albus TaxID=3870 RepID=A0A6A4P5W7_LUPAL|nr:hypothetical protein Lalb_Chr18g0049071 [Lupinus albus]
MVPIYLSFKGFNHDLNTQHVSLSAYHYILVAISITLSTVFNGDMYLTDALNGGFSVELIHRDYPKSPFYNSSETQIER